MSMFHQQLINMKKTKKLLSFCIPALCLLCAGNLYASNREVLFNKGWKFHLGSAANAEQPTYNDSQWRTLNLPHDWSVEPVAQQCPGITIGPFSKLSEKRYPANQQMGGWCLGRRANPWWRRLVSERVHPYPRRCRQMYHPLHRSRLLTIGSMD